MRRASIATATSLLAALAACADTPDDDPVDDHTAATWQTLSASDVLARYQSVKTAEADLVASGQPIATPTLLVNMGTFDAATGVFTGKKKTCYREPGYPGLLCDYWEEPANGLDLDLRFVVVNGTTAPTATFTNELGEVISATGAANSSVTVRVRRGTSFTWRVGSSGRSYSDQITFDRPVAVGAFTVDVMPISYLYDPPEFGNFVSWAEYAHTQSWGSSITTELTTSKSKKLVAPNTTDLAGFKTALDGAAAIARLAPEPGGKIASALGILNNLFGTVTHSTVEGTEERVTGRLDLFESETVIYQTRNMVGLTGPGRGDRILLARDVKLAWLIANGIPTLTVLGWTKEQAPSVDQLRKDRVQLQNGGTATNTGLSRRALDSLLALDPAVTGSTAAADFPGARFRFIGSVSGNGTERRSFTDSRLASDANSTMTFKTDVTDSKPGWLSFMGFGPSEESSVSLTSSHRVTEQVSLGESTTQSFEMNGAYDIEVYRDTVFGGFLPIRSDSCVGDCGRQDDDSGCWCDSLCTGYGDCCPDYQDVCVAP